jgi:type IV secretion system protein VirB6
MVDFNNGIVSAVFASVDETGANLVVNTYRNLVNTYEPVMWIFVTLFCGFYFLQMMFGAKAWGDTVPTVFKVVTVMVLATHYDYFGIFIYDIFTREPMEIMKCVSFNSDNINFVSVNHALDEIINAGFTFGNNLMLDGGWMNPIKFIMGFILMVVTALSVGFAAGLVVLAKASTIILLALSPLFIFFALYQSTKSMFDAWIQQLIGYALVPILTCTVVMINFNAMQVSIEMIKQAGTPKLTVIFPYVFMSIIQFYLLAHVLKKAASLAGGFSLAGFHSTMQQTKESIGKSLNAATGGKVGRAAMKTLGVMGASVAWKGAKHISSRLSRYRSK